MKLIMGVCGLAGIVGFASAISIACYVAEGMNDTYPIWILVALAVAALGQAATSVFLMIRRALGAALWFLVFATPLAILEWTTMISVDYARNFLSTAALILSLCAVAAIAFARDRLYPSN